MIDVYADMALMPSVATILCGRRHAACRHAIIAATLCCHFRHLLRRHYAIVYVYC